MSSPSSGCVGSGVTPRVRGAGLARGGGGARASRKRALSEGRGIAAPLENGALRAAATAGAIRAGLAAGAEDELGRRRRLGGEAGIVGEDEEATVEALAQFKAPAGVGASAWQLQPAGSEADRVVVGHDARIAATQVRGQSAGRRPPGRGRAPELPLYARRTRGRRRWRP